MLRALIFVVSVLYSYLIFGQSPSILRGDPAYHTYDRAEILRWADTTMMNSVNNYERKHTVAYFKEAWKNKELTANDRYDLLHVFSDNYEFLDEGSKVKNTISKILDVFRGSDDEDKAPKKVDKLYFNQEPILKYFYKTPANFLQIEVPSFKVYINPVV